MTDAEDRPTTTTFSRAVRELVRKMAAGEGHRASWDTYERVISSGLAFFVPQPICGPSGYVVTPLGFAVIAGRRRA